MDRLKQHNRTKEFWNYAVAMVSKINAFTKSHAKYLEHVAIVQAKDANRYETENQTAPGRPFVTESMEADLLDSFDTIKILLSTLGFPVYDKVAEPGYYEIPFMASGLASGVYFYRLFADGKILTERMVMVN